VDSDRRIEICFAAFLVQPVRYRLLVRYSGQVDVCLIVESSVWDLFQDGRLHKLQPFESQIDFEEIVLVFLSFI
jgi:hypothetical protein